MIKENKMDKENKKELILNTFKQSILVNGYSKVSINSLTAQCNISKGSFYTYFSSKDEILSIVIAEYKNLLKNILKDCSESSKSLDEFLDKYIKYRLKLNDEELELELILANLFRNLEILSSENLKKIYNLPNVHRDNIKENLKKYTNFSKSEILTYSKMIEGIRTNFLIDDIFEIDEGVFKIKNLEEVKKLLISNEMEEKREFVLKNIKKMLV
ncbi:MAG: TetR/AcrR family transcriptional regulator [Fusobacterium sp.]|uniref:TetR/AcrR family transcriptional regulator n=1 Tax=Fusobacterium sp. TaxID=68766 RepID=UPI0026DD3F8A|nr:TetR/AcrR family transcriptional regulator [Fusobacterium sp.]MDO4689979.1 TetR/AcrR family transcriptional regulator [Fusobacterium sp.]